MKRSGIIVMLAFFGGLTLLVGLLYLLSAVSSAQNRASTAELASDRAVQDLQLLRRQLEECRAQQAKIELTAKADRERAESLLGEIRTLLAKSGAPNDTIGSLMAAADDQARAKALDSVGLRHLPADNRLKSGSVLKDRLSVLGGSGSLTLINGLAEDAHVKIVQQDSLAAAFYVRGGETFTFAAIPDGAFTVLYCTGYGWNQQQLDFSRGRNAFKYDKSLNYTTRKQREGNYITTTTDQISLTLHKVAGGNTSTSPISLAEFDRY